MGKCRQGKSHKCELAWISVQAHHPAHSMNITATVLTFNGIAPPLVNHVGGAEAASAAVVVNGGRLQLAELSEQLLGGEG